MEKLLTRCRIVENAWLAGIAARKLGSPRAAVTLGRRIYLWNTDRATFLKDDRWVRHELCHVRQFSQYGFMGFLFRYLVETLRRGYRENRFEREAREAEESAG